MGNFLGLRLGGFRWSTGVLYRPFPIHVARLVSPRLITESLETFAWPWLYHHWHGEDK